ncbi:MAG: hypothetical protein NZV14_08915 [Bryobacteraceae bacterium]|nr:hypothetical protein [Bryobacteraceae bacterium]MDW8378270.1 R3H domain-containing nucleic acid-binding protein [Bryobacterales bacterium]
MAERIYTVEEHGPRIDAFLRTVIGHMGLELDFTIDTGDNPHPDIEDPELVVRFTGPDVQLLLANKAELLLALEYLTMEMLRMPSEHHERLCFDANDHRMLRIAELRLSAQTAAERVKRSKVPFRFSPMSSRERRIIHLALRHDTEVRSESSGVGPHRQVVIYPAGMPTPPEPPRPPISRTSANRGPGARKSKSGSAGERDLGPRAGSQERTGSRTRRFRDRGAGKAEGSKSGPTSPAGGARARSGISKGGESKSRKGSRGPKPGAEEGTSQS